MNRKNMLMIALTVYLSCAEMATPPKTESHTIAIPRHAAAGERRQVWVRVPHESEEERLRFYGIREAVTRMSNGGNLYKGIADTFV